MKKLKYNLKINYNNGSYDEIKESDNIQFAIDLIEYAVPIIKAYFDFDKIDVILNDIDCNLIELTINGKDFGFKLGEGFGAIKRKTKNKILIDCWLYDYIYDDRFDYIDSFSLDRKSLEEFYQTDFNY